MVGANKSITILNENNGVYSATIIKGATWTEQLEKVPTEKGLVSNRSVTIRIPINSFPIGKKFIPPQEKCNDFSNCWTVRPQKDFIIYGEVRDVSNIQNIISEHDVVRPMLLKDNRIGSPFVQHIRIECK